MFCEDCKKMIVMNAFSFSKCKKCGTEVVTPHIPSYQYCEDCAHELNVCEQCGKSLSEKKDS